MLVQERSLEKQNNQPNRDLFMTTTWPNAMRVFTVAMETPLVNLICKKDIKNER